MDRCICCGRELDYEGTLVCWACAKFGEGGNQHVAIHHPGHQRHCGGQTANSIILTAFGDKPTIDLPIRVILREDS